jgi:type IV pilus assembly protein PilB
MVDRDAARLIPQEMARRLTAIPIASDEAGLVVAMADPLDIFCLDDIRKTTEKDIRQVVASRSDILRAIDRSYSINTVIEAVSKDFAGVSGGSSRMEVPEEALSDVVSEDAPVVKLVSMLIAQAIMERASDIHISPEGAEVKVLPHRRRAA